MDNENLNSSIEEAVVAKTIENLEAAEEAEEVEADEKEFSVKDSLTLEVDRLKTREELKDLKIKEAEERSAIRAKEKVKIEKKRNHKNFFNKIFSTNFYISKIQAMEPLIEVIAKDAIYLCMITSILYSFYIIVNMDAKDFNWIYILFKILGSTIVTILSYIIINNWGEKFEPEKNEE